MQRMVISRACRPRHAVLSIDEIMLKREASPRGEGLRSGVCYIVGDFLNLFGVPRSSRPTMFLC